MWGAEVTFDLTKASYYSSSQTEVVWTSTPVTMKIEKGSSSTNANNYLGGTNSNTRCYSGQVFSVSVSSGYELKTIVITSTSSSYIMPTSGWSNATATSNGSVVTVTANSGATVISVNPGGTKRLTKVEITYESSTPAVPCTVTFNAGPGTCAASVTEASAGAGVTLPTPTLDCGDWEFAGWKTTSAVTTETTTEPTLIPAGAYSPTSDITLYAVYQRTEDGGGGSTTGSKTLVSNSSSSYYESGYITGVSGTNSASWTADGFTMVQNKNSSSNAVALNYAEIRVYASHSIVFTPSTGSTITSIVATATTDAYANALGGSSITNCTKSVSSSIVTITPTDGTKAITITNTAQSRLKTIVVNYTTSGGGSTTYYHSTPSCTTETAVTLNPNGGDGEETTATIEGTTYTVTDCSFTRDGYTFSHWDTQADDSGVDYDPDDIINLNGTPITLYAQWTCETPVFDIKIKDDNPVVFSGESIELTVVGSNIAADATYQWYKKNGENYDELTGETTDKLTIAEATANDAGNYKCVVTNGTCSAENNYTVKMYSLRGLTDNNWSTDFVFTKVNATTATYSIELAANENYEFKIFDGSAYYGNTGGNNPTMTSDNCTNWTMQENMGNNVTLQTTAAGIYTFTLDYTDASNPTISVTYPAKRIVYLNPDVWASDNPKFAVHAWHGSTAEDILMTKIDDCDNDRNIYYAEIDAAHTHVIFIRGNRESYNITNPWDNVWNQTGDLTIDNVQYNIGSEWDFSKASWTAFTPNYTVTFDANGHGTAPDAPCVAKNGKAPTPAAPTATGYTFGGWYTDQACNNAWDFENDLVTEDITLYAKWTVNTHTLTWNVNGGNALTGTYTSGAVDYGAAITKPTDPTRTGYTFQGWHDGTSIVTPATTMPDKDLTYTAQWQICLYTLTWDLNGGTVTTAGTHAAEGVTGSPSGGVEYGASITAPIVERDGYRFDGWDTEPATTMGTTDLTYTAQWTKVYTVTFYNNGGAYNTLTDLESGDAVTFPATDPTSCDTEYYPHFIGWTINPINGSTDEEPDLVTSATVSDEDLEYHAVFAAGTPGTTSTTVDVLNRAFTGVSGTSYSSWSGKTATSSAVYAGQSAGGNDAIQLRSKNNNSGIITTTSGGKATKVVVSWNSNTSNDRTLNVYGKNSAYEAATDLYDNSTQGTLLGTIVKGTSTELTIDGDYEYIGLRSNIDPMYLDEIQITWSAGSAANYTSFITSCCDATANLVLTPNPASPIALDIDGNTSTTISFATENGEEALYYRPTITPSENTSLTINGTWNNYTSSAGSYTYNFTATGTYTIKQEFKQDGYDCKKSASATINVVANPILQVSEPTITSECGTEGTPVAVTIDSRYLTGSSLTAQIATTTDTEHGTFKICATENGTFATTNLTGLTAGQDSKASVTIYVRYDAAVDNIDDATGTLTITDGTTSQTITLTTTPTCGTSIRMTPTDANSVRVTTANGQWTRTQTAIHLRGAYLLQNLTGEQGAKVELTSSNQNFKFVKPDVASSGTTKYESEKITNNTWEADVYLVYTPTAHNQNETTTITAKVITFGGTTEHATSTLEAYGRSFPETFVLALYTGSEWVALPADMIAPYGTGCTTGVGTHDPYPITVDDNANPTAATLAPTRAIYKGAARNTPMTNPWTIQFESNTQAGYYLFGSNNANTTIANTNQATGEGVKWALSTADNITYQLLQTTATEGQRLGYNATAKYMGQYQSTATNFKYDFRILPVEETCTYYIEPVMTLVDYTDDEAKVHIQYDGTNLYQISMDNKSTWTNVTGEIDCLNLTFTLPNTTYRGKDVWLKPQGTLCEEVVSTTACHIPAPVINNPGDQTFTGTVNQPFTGTFAITGSDLYQDISAITITDNSNPAIGATINNGTITVTMGASAVGTYTTNLTFDAVGAEEVTVKVTIEIRALATQSFDGGSYAFTDATPKVLCENLVDENTQGWKPEIYLSYPLYKDGDAISSTSELNETNFTLIDLNTGESLSFSREGFDDGVAKITLNATCRSNMIVGHTYRLSWENTNQVMTNKDGLPYMDCYMDFVYSENCDAPTALAACPITNSSFTANWAPVADCTGDVTVDVYTRGTGTTIIDKTTFSTSEVNNLQYAGTSNLSGNYWITNIHETGAGAPSIDASDRLLISDVSTPKYYNLFSPLLSNLGTINESTIYTITVTLYQQTSDAGAGAYFYVMDNGNNLTKNTTPTITNKSVTIDGQTATSKKLTYGTTTFTVKGLSSDDRIRLLGFEQSNIASNKKNVYISSIKIEASGSITPVASKTVACSTGSAEFTDLSANTTYYYTVTDGSSNTSNEIAVTTYNGESELKFYSDEACTTEITETTVLGGEETTVYVKGTRVPACDINASVSNGYGMDDSNISYTTGSGAVSGSIILTLADANTTEGTLTITDAEGNNYVLNIVSSDCPAGFGTMALPATNITNESAQANWKTTLDFGDDKSGTLHLYKNGVVNRELIVNGDFETGSLDAGWSNGINNGEVGAAHSFDQYTIKNSSSEAHNGSYSLYVTANGSTLTNFHGQSVMYADYITLTPGTYRMSAWVKMPTASGYDDKMQYFSLGIITGKNGSEHVYTVSTPVTVYSNNTYVQLTHEFEVTSTITACPAIGASSGTFRYFYLDDVSLVCTSIGQSDEPYLSIDIADLSAGNLALTDLSGNTEYTYVIQNAAGCSSNPITFQTKEAGAPVITPNDVAITCQVGNSTNGIMTLTVKDVYSDIYISNSCTERITLNTTQLPKEGGVVNFTFTPLNTDQGGETGTCTISFTTKGLSTPAIGIITWTVTAGVDPDLPIIDVTDITNTSLNIEHNVEGDGVQIVISRERQEDEIEDNIGEEIFFSKYYEAYMHKKLWAIYNPTKEKISLANTYVWRSNGKGTDWNIEGGLDLSQMGNIESGYIYPNEELIVYTSDQVGECEQSKADMTNWVAMSSSDPALSFSGNDALLLVRKNIDGDADNPPTESVELDSNGDPYELNWRQYTDAEGNSWWMLDIIGARQNNNKPDITATGSWTWDCNGQTETEKGDAAGWYGDQGEHLNATLYKDCGYVLSTNRCLLIRKESVKSGYKAINENIGDMFTLGKNDYPTEWRGAHVPQDGNQEETSCENFTYVGGYDYESYYNAWTDLDNLQPAVQQPDGSWLVEGVDVPNFYCHPLLIEVLITDTVNGEEVENVSAYLEYKVPIVVDGDAKTNDTRYFVKPTPENVLSPEICAECDVVIRDGAKLTHIEDGRAEFRNMQVYPTAKFEIPAGLNMQLAGLHMYAKNDEVGYAIINNDGSSIHAEDIIHIKRIDDMYWYPFSLPYDCKVSSIYQINGKSMGEYWVDWGIKYYDGEARQQEGDNYAGGATSKFWKKLDASETLKAHQGYIIGLFTTEWQGQMKSIYFPPVENTEYTEGGNDAKTTYISNWSDNLNCEPRHRGWNFTGLPYISLFSSQNGDGTTNNNSLMMGSQTDDYATSSIVYVSIPDGGDSRTYTQVSAASVKLEPFKPYFVQAMDPTDGQSHNDIALTYSKGGRTLDKIQARSAASTQATIIVELVVTNADATLTDNAGVLVSDRYTEKYEIGADLMKMYAADRKPQLFTRAINNEMMAYNALPDHLAQNIPLGIYLPNTDEYTISIIDYASQLSDAEAVYLLYNGEIVANLLYADYIVQVQQAGLINGYSLDIRRKQKTTTDINNLTDGTPIITIVDGQIVIQQLPDNAEVQIIDVLGRVLYQQANVPDIITFQAPATGVYNVVITTTEQQFTHKTIIR